MVQQPAREAIEKNKKECPTTGGQRNTQTRGKEIHRPEIDKAKEKAFACKLKKKRAF